MEPRRSSYFVLRNILRAIRRQGLEREAGFDRTSGGARVMGEARSGWKHILVM